MEYNKIMSYMSDEKYIQRIMRYLRDAGICDVAIKLQFGGHAVFSANIMFAILLKNQMYLKLSKEQAKKMLGQEHDGILDMKHGYPKVNGYYLLDEQNITSNEKFRQIITRSVEAISKIKAAERIALSSRIKDQANMNYDFERKFSRIGIHTIDELRNIGAREAYIRLTRINIRPHFVTLIKLEGAIQGKHIAVLDNQTIEKYKVWWSERFKQKTEDA